MKPKPFSSLNHLTVPVAMSLLPGERRTSNAEGISGAGSRPAERAETYQRLWPDGGVVGVRAGTTESTPGPAPGGGGHPRCRHGLAEKPRMIAGAGRSPTLRSVLRTVAAIRYVAPLREG